MESFCPIHIDLKDRFCLVTGGGKFAGQFIVVSKAEALAGKALQLVERAVAEILEEFVDKMRLPQRGATYRSFKAFVLTCYWPGRACRFSLLSYGRR